MTDKKVTDEEIIKAVECCSDPCVICDECPLYCVGANCSSFELHRYALDLINRQKSEIKRLQKEVNLVSIQFQDLQERTDEIKLEAYKEFAERLKRSTVTAVIGNEIYAVATSKGVDNLLKEMVGDKE